MLDVRKRRRFWDIRLLLLILLIGVSIVLSLRTLIVGAPKSSSRVEVQVAKIKTVKITSNILLTGNIFFGRYINDWSMASELKYAYPFSRLNEFDRSKYDAWISGLECPSVPGVNRTSEQEDANLQFNCSPNYLPELAKWFTIVTLANNHTDNQGEGGFKTTQEQLEKVGIQYFGSYDPNVVDDVCEVVAMPVVVVKSDNSTASGKLPVAMCGYNGVFKIPSSGSVEAIRKYSQIMPVIAMPHMGAEYKAAPDEIKVNFYRKLIDAGADMVIGDHPHWVQTSESYNGRLIIYSMGNFIFDQQGNNEVTRSAAIGVSIQTSNGETTLLDAWLKLGESCMSYKDNCLKTAEAEGLKKLSILYKFSVVGTNDANHIAKPATAEQLDLILQRLNWRSTIEQLQSPYSGL